LSRGNLSFAKLFFENRKFPVAKETLLWYYIYQRKEVFFTPNNMAQRIKTLRKERGLTLEQVALVVGVGKSTVRKWETGMIANMKRDKIAALAKALNTTPAYLMGWEEVEQKNDVLADIILRAQNDDQFFKALETIYNMEPDKLSSFLVLLQ
jgi:transcriptional regulator with XRE-family HTH domain